MAEAVRLVIWDLDETFWVGTLTEGGIQYQKRAHEIVIELAGRGIMSSICSKNNYDSVREILVMEGIWDYFIFPSIDWQPKGQRIAQIIEYAQFRAASVLFVDDNPMNLHEAQHSAPGLQIAGPELMSAILDDPRFEGKDDSGLSRLKQYKTLEHRHEAQSNHADNVEFLRASGIRVVIDSDVDAHIDRVIELINRTNQLNFTKRRLSEDLDKARHQIRLELHERNTQAGLIRVTDNYGDYGITGFYLLHVHTWRLVHFCFSCRTLGMGVERWLYERLRRPSITVVGEVQSDLSDALPPIDWINSGDASVHRDHGERIGRAFLRGGCEIQAVAHYFALHTDTLTTEFAFDRGGLPIPIHHSVFLRASIGAISDREVAAAARLGYERSDFQSAAASNSPPFDLYVYSFWADAHFALYRDRDTSLRLPFGIHGLNNGMDLRKVDAAELQDKLREPGMEKKVEMLRQHFDYLTWSPGIQAAAGATLLEENLKIVFNASPRSSKIFVLLACQQVFDTAGRPAPVPHLAELNSITRLATTGFAHVHLIDPLSFIESPSDVIDATHFDRRVYFRIYQHIVGAISEVCGAPQFFHSP